MRRILLLKKIRQQKIQKIKLKNINFTNILRIF